METRQSMYCPGSFYKVSPKKAESFWPRRSAVQFSGNDEERNMQIGAVRILGVGCSLESRLFRHMRKAS